MSRIYKELSKLASEITSNPIRTWAKDNIRHFTEEYIYMVNNHMKRCSMSLAIREMQIKTTMRYHYTPIRIVNIKNRGNTKCWQGIRNGTTHILLAGMKNGPATLKNSRTVSEKAKHIPAI